MTANDRLSEWAVQFLRRASSPGGNVEPRRSGASHTGEKDRTERRVEGHSKDSPAACLQKGQAHKARTGATKCGLAVSEDQQARPWW